MKREFLKNLGLEDENIDKIMSEHGKSIEAEKSKAVKALDDVKAKQAEIDEIKGSLEKLQADGADAEKVKAELEGLKDKIAKDEATAKEQAELTKLHAELDSFLPENQAFMNDYARNGIYSEAVAKFKAEPTKGLKSHFESLIKDADGNFNEGIFKNPIQPSTIPPMGNGSVNDLNGDNLRRAMGLSATPQNNGA